MNAVARAHLKKYKISGSFFDSILKYKVNVIYDTLHQWHRKLFTALLHAHMMYDWIPKHDFISVDML